MTNKGKPRAVTGYFVSENYLPPKVPARRARTSVFSPPVVHARGHPL
jgi:hypothetical protein